MFVRLQRRRYHARPSSVPLARNNEQQPNGKRERERERQKKYENSYLFFFLKEKKDNQPTSTATNFRRRRRRKDGAAQKPPTHPLPGGWVGGVWLSWQPPPTPSPSSARHHVADTWWSPPTDLSPCRCRLVAQRGPLFTDLWNNRYYSFVFHRSHPHTHTHTHSEQQRNAVKRKRNIQFQSGLTRIGALDGVALFSSPLSQRPLSISFHQRRRAKIQKKKPQKLGQCGRFPRISDSNSKKNKTTKPVGFFLPRFFRRRRRRRRLLSSFRRRLGQPPKDRPRGAARIEQDPLLIDAPRPVPGPHATPPGGVLETPPAHPQKKRKKFQ